MAGYQVAIVKRSEGFSPAALDEVPAELGHPLEIAAEADDLFVAVRQAVDYNRQSVQQGRNRWAVVVEPGSLGRHWPGARLCTPISYKVTAIWWPEGWEPNTPVDVPSCLWQAQSRNEQPPMSHEQAEATVRGLNRQCMDSPGTNWYVLIGVENESISRSISYDPAGIETTVEVRRMHVILPEGGGHGDCSHCPAHRFSCAKAEWTSRSDVLTTRENRACCSAVASPSGPVAD